MSIELNNQAVAQMSDIKELDEALKNLHLALIALPKSFRSKSSDNENHSSSYSDVNSSFDDHCWKSDTTPDCQGSKADRSLYLLPVQIHPCSYDKYLAETIICFNIGIAYYFRMTEDDDEASLWFQRALCISSRHDRQDHSNRSHTLYYIIAHNVGYTSWHLDRHEDALSAYSLALEYLTSIIKARRKIMLQDPEQYPHNKHQILFAISMTLNCMAISRLHTKNQSQESIDISHQETLQIISTALAATQELIHGTDIIDELVQMSSSEAVTLVADANINHNKVKVEETALLGNIHKSTVTSLFHIAQGKLGNTEEAILAYDSFLSAAISADNQGKESHKIAIALTTIGQLCCNINDFDRAMEYLPRAIKASHSAFGRNHEVTAFALNQVGTAFYGLGNCDAALSAFKTGLEIELNLDNARNEDIIATMSNIADIHRLNGNHRESLYYYGKALKLIRQHPDVNNLNLIASLLKGKSSAHEELGEIAPAEASLKDALDVMTDLNSNCTYEFSIILNSLGLLRFKKRDYTGALESFQASLKIRNFIPVALSPSSIALLCNNIAASYRKLGNLNRSLEFYKKTLRIEIECRGDYHPHNILSSMTHIASVYKEKGFDTQALKYYTEAEKYSIQNRTELNFDDIYNAIMRRHRISAFIDRKET